MKKINYDRLLIIVSFCMLDYAAFAERETAIDPFKHSRRINGDKRLVSCQVQSTNTHSSTTKNQNSNKVSKIQLIGKPAVVTDVCDVKENADEESVTLSHLEVDTKLVIVGQSEGWVRILTVDRHVGWIQIDKVKIQISGNPSLKVVNEPSPDVRLPVPKNRTNADLKYRLERSFIIAMNEVLADDREHRKSHVEQDEPGEFKRYGPARVTRTEYNITHTNSIISPYMGTFKYTEIRLRSDFQVNAPTRAEAALLPLTYLYTDEPTYIYAFQNGRWVFKDVNYR